MNDLRTAAQQALEALETCDAAHPSDGGQQWYDEKLVEPAITALKAALAQEQAEPVDPASKMTAGRAVYFIERFKREEKLLGPNEQAALDFVISMLERQEQAKPAQGPVAWVECDGELVWNNKEAAIGRNLYTAPPKAEPAQEPVAWMGAYDKTELYYRKPPQADVVPLYAAPPKAEPAQEPVTWVASEDGCVIYDDISMDDVVLRVSGDFENDEQRIRRAKRIVNALNAAPPRRTMVPLTDEEILAAVGWERAEMYIKLTPNFPVDEAKKETLKNARAIEKASWEKNHGQA